MIFDVPNINEINKNKLNSKISSVVFNTTKNRYEYYNGNLWTPFGINNHNLLENINVGPFYHSNQPINIDDDVTFKSLKINETITIGNYNVSSNSSSFSFKKEDIEIAKITNSKELFIGSIIGNNFQIKSDGSAIFNSINISNDLNISGDINVQGTINISTIDNLSIQDSILEINNTDMISTYNQTDIGIKFNYFDTSKKIGFFGLELDSNGKIKYFKILEECNSSFNIFSGNSSSLKIKNIIADALLINNIYSIDNNGKATLNSLIVNSKKYRNGVSPLLNSNDIDLSLNDYLIYYLDGIDTEKEINITNGKSGEIFYLKIKSNGNQIKWNENIKWPINQNISDQNKINQYSIYTFTCFDNNIFYGNFSFNYEE